jgi:sugar-specific transcriptional regulator TrmB
MVEPRRAGAIEGRSLEILGVSEPEERAYRQLLAQPGATLRELARSLSLSPSRGQRLLAALEAKGLATHSPGRPRRYLPAAPDMAIEALILEREEELQRARITARRLQQQLRAVRPDDGPGPMVELITSREAQRQVLEHLNRTARQEIVALVRLPVRLPRLGPARAEGQHAQRAATRRGVRIRSIVDTDYLVVPGAVQTLRDDLAAGEEVRVVRHLPFKLVVADRRTAILPLDLPAGGTGSPALLVRSSPLLDALHTLFELLWERAGPIGFTGTGELRTGPRAQLSEPAANLVPLMAAGLTDKTIARELGMSVRTLERRVAELVVGLEARTRFQAGWLAARRFAPPAADAAAEPVADAAAEPVAEPVADHRHGGHPTAGSVDLAGRQAGD